MIMVRKYTFKDSNDDVKHTPAHAWWVEKVAMLFTYDISFVNVQYFVLNTCSISYRFYFMRCAFIGLFNSGNLPCSQ